MTYRLVFSKKISLFVALLLLLGSVLALGAPGGSASPENYLFTVTDSGAVVTAYLGSGFADVVVPDTLGEQPVVAIGIGAFWGNEEVRSVQLPRTVTQLDSNAFADCKRLATLHAVGLTTIGDYALYGCDSLTEIIISDNLLSVGKQAMGEAHPAVSLEAGNTLEDLLQVHKALSEHGSMTLGSVGDVVVTDKLLALNNSLSRLLGSTEAISAEGLWAADAVTVTAPHDGSTTDMSFVQFNAQLHSSGLYNILDTSKQTRLQLRLDALLEALLADAQRL